MDTDALVATMKNVEDRDKTCKKLHDKMTAQQAELQRQLVRTSRRTLRSLSVAGRDQPP